MQHNFILHSIINFEPICLSSKTGRIFGVFLPVKDYGYTGQSGTLPSTNAFYPVMFNSITKELIIKPQVININSLTDWNNFFVSTNSPVGLILDLSLMLSAPSNLFLPPISRMKNFDSFEIYRVVSSASISSASSVRIEVNTVDTSFTIILGGGTTSYGLSSQNDDRFLDLYSNTYIKFTYVNSKWFAISMYAN